MSEGLNRVILLGNIGAEPELRFTASGVAVLRVRLATNETFFDKNIPKGTVKMEDVKVLEMPAKSAN